MKARSNLEAIPCRDCQTFGGTVKYKPFDPGDDADAMADHFRIQLCNLVLDADRLAVYRDLDQTKKIECVMGGVLVGLIGICFASVNPEGRDAMMEAITEYLPQARDQAEAVMRGSGADRR